MKSRNFLTSILRIQAPSVANTEFSVTHGLTDALGKPIRPAGAFNMRGFVSTGTPGIFYLGATAWTNTTAFLKCNTGSAFCDIMFFV